MLNITNNQYWVDQEGTPLSVLVNKVDRGNIDGAENDLFELTSGDDARKLKLALLFYSFLNEKDDSFLEEHHFRREEIQQGIRDLVSLYNITGITEPFLSDL